MYLFTLFYLCSSNGKSKGCIGVGNQKTWRCWQSKNSIISPDMLHVLFMVKYFLLAWSTAEVHNTYLVSTLSQVRACMIWPTQLLVKECLITIASWFQYFYQPSVCMLSKCYDILCVCLSIIFTFSASTCSTNKKSDTKGFCTVLDVLH